MKAAETLAAPQRDQAAIQSWLVQRRDGEKRDLERLVIPTGGGGVGSMRDDVGEGHNNTGIDSLKSSQCEENGTVSDQAGEYDAGMSNFALWGSPPPPPPLVSMDHAGPVAVAGRDLGEDGDVPRGSEGEAAMEAREAPAVAAVDGKVPAAALIGVAAQQPGVQAMDDPPEPENLEELTATASVSAEDADIAAPEEGAEAVVLLPPLLEAAPPESPRAIVENTAAPAGVDAPAASAHSSPSAAAPGSSSSTWAGAGQLDAAAIIVRAVAAAASRRRTAKLAALEERAAAAERRCLAKEAALLAVESAARSRSAAASRLEDELGAASAELQEAREALEDALAEAAEQRAARTAADRDAGRQRWAAEARAREVDHLQTELAMRAPPDMDTIAALRSKEVTIQRLQELRRLRENVAVLELQLRQRDFIMAQLEQSLVRGGAGGEEEEEEAEEESAIAAAEAPAAASNAVGDDAAAHADTEAVRRSSALQEALSGAAFHIKGAIRCLGQPSAKYDVAAFSRCMLTAALRHLCEAAEDDEGSGEIGRSLDVPEFREWLARAAVQARESSADRMAAGMMPPALDLAQQQQQQQGSTPTATMAPATQLEAAAAEIATQAVAEYHAVSSGGGGAGGGIPASLSADKWSEPAAASAAAAPGTAPFSDDGVVWRRQQQQPVPTPSPQPYVATSMSPSAAGASAGRLSPPGPTGLVGSLSTGSTRSLGSSSGYYVDARGAGVGLERRGIAMEEGSRSSEGGRLTDGSGRMSPPHSEPVQVRGGYILSKAAPLPSTSPALRDRDVDSQGQMASLRQQFSASQQASSQQHQGQLYPQREREREREREQQYPSSRDLLSQQQPQSFVPRDPQPQYGMEPPRQQSQQQHANYQPYGRHSPATGQALSQQPLPTQQPRSVMGYGGSSREQMDPRQRQRMMIQQQQHQHQQAAQPMQQQQQYGAGSSGAGGWGSGRGGGGRGTSIYDQPTATMPRRGSTNYYDVPMSSSHAATPTGGGGSSAGSVEDYYGAPRSRHVMDRSQLY